MSLDFVLIPFCIFAILFLLNRENKIYLKNGEFFEVRHIAACDGIKSLCHKKISTANSNPIYSGYSVWRAILESKQSSINFHLGPNFHVVSYPAVSYTHLTLPTKA